ncbi:RhoGAP-domain-containing protein [Polychaeton citri CBS 116435]|uniref:RhoGAP-domain-containing protein n=1 Tax=Polychaeton citri CBS 116435 TaxID=1314669 RepID=A0A9P4Q476_9PEZI|nr:RhoGAP-domain-containing protein [Polychaeton citri CBS 116435]
MPSSPSPVPASAAPAGPPEAVEKVMYSDIGISTLLNRLRQSIASARDFAAFLKKRSQLEEEQASGLKQLARKTSEGIRRADSKDGSYRGQMDAVLRLHERMADNGMQFALSLHQMHEDLNELSANMEKGRKQWKHEGLDAEKRASDAEQAMHKAKAKYDQLAEDYDRARTGDSKGSRRIGLKGPKSAEQYEQDLHRKVITADGEYEERVKQAKAQRDQLVRTDRPKAVKAIQELVKESDSALALQLQKFATFNEKLLLGNGLVVSPLPTEDNLAGRQRSMRDLVYDIDNDRDFHNYVSSHANKIPARPSEIKYEQHPTLAPKTQQPTKSTTQGHTTAPPQAAPNLSVNTGGDASKANSTTSRHSGAPPPTYPVSQPVSSFSTQPEKSPYAPSPAYQQPASASPYGGTTQPPYPLHPSERTGTSNLATPASAGPTANRSLSNQLPSGASMSPSTNTHHLPPITPVFGISLHDLFARDQTAVPMVVYQCTQGIELFGLDTEGLYRLSGTASHVNILRERFNHSGGQAPDLDFRIPGNFFHDVNAVATLLKQFFRELPEPLFTNSGYQSFIDAARIDHDIARRDALHQTINDLPDPNYATLRAIVLHLARVMEHENRNRMTSNNLAVCFAPTLMGASSSGPQMADAALQARVLDTILLNATAIFDDD